MAYTTANEVTIREDLSGYVSNLDPADIPLQATLGRVPVTQKRYEFSFDDFGITRTISSIASNAKGENAAFFNTGSATVSTNFSAERYPGRAQAIMQINWDGVTVSGTERSSVFGGITDPFEYRLYKSMVKVANDQEIALLWGTGTDYSAATRQTQGLIHWCAQTGLARSLGASATSTNCIWDVDGTTTGNAISGRFWSNMYNASSSNIDLSMMTDKILGNAVDFGFRVPQSIGFAGRKVKAAIANFALSVNGPINYRQIPAMDNTVSENVTYIETASHGKVGIFYNRYFDLQGQSMALNNTTTGGTPPQSMTAVSGLYNASFPCNKTIIFAMPDYCKIGTLRGLGWGPLPRLTDGDVGAVVGEQGFVCLNPVGLTGAINALAF